MLDAVRWKRLARVVLLVLGGMREWGWAQAIGPGVSMARPEDRTGWWEALDGRGHVLALEVQIGTRGEPGQDLRAAQQIEGVQMGLFLRRAGNVQVEWTRWRDDPPDSLAEGKLIWQIALEEERPGFPEQLQLEAAPHGDLWGGWLLRDGRREPVSLRRSAVSVAKDRLVGTWAAVGRSNCLHIGEGADGMPTAWLDQLTDMHRMRWRAGLTPSPTLEEYGRPLTIEHYALGFVEFRMAGASGMAGMPFVLRVRETAAGRRLLGMHSGGGGNWAEPDWIRVRGTSCR